jgi:uncharacterized OB-fold protein
MPDETGEKVKPGDFNAASYNAFLSDERQLMGVRCLSCGHISAQARPVCPNCPGKDVEWFQFSGRGRLATFTCISIVTKAMEAKGYGRDNPCCSGIVTLEEGPRVSALILGVDGANPQNIKTDAEVVLDLSDLDPENPALAFRPV